MADNENDDEVGTDFEADNEVDDTQDDPAAQAYVKDDGSVFTRRDFDALQEALRKSRKEARTAKRQTGPDGSKDAEEDAAAAAEAKFKPLLVRQAAKAAFAAAGLASGTGLSRALKLLDVDDLVVGDDGEVEGLDEQIDEIRQDFPGLFEAKSAGRHPGRVDGGARGSEGARKELSASERQARALLGR
jgi:hypothetical protein